MPRRLAHAAGLGVTVAVLAGAPGGGLTGGVSETAAAPVAPHCAPAQLDVSARRAGGRVEVSPLPGSADASPGTQISLLGPRATDLRVSSVTGSSTGRHRGRLRAYSQGDGASFVPSRPFAGGETVTVNAAIVTGSGRRPFAFRFSVATEDPIPHNPFSRPRGPRHGEVQNFRTRPDLQPPNVEVLTDAPGASPLPIVTAPYSGYTQHGPMILDAHGRLIWFHPLPLGTEATDVQVQRLDGQPVLTWWQGFISLLGFGQGEHEIYDEHYRPIGRVQAGNGLEADLHELELTGERTAFLTADNPIRCDLSAVGGSRDAAVTDALMQEVDLRTGLVRFEWHGLDHVPLRDTYMSPRIASPAAPLDYLHLNSIDPTHPGLVLISARNTGGVYVIDHDTGRVSWRLGGRAPSFAMGAGTHTAFQHDARWRGSNTISLFDNGGVPRVEAQSRGLYEDVSPATGRVTLRRLITHSPALRSGSQGDVQELLNGNVFVGWGAQPWLSEYDPAGRVVFDAYMTGHNLAYRAFRTPWTGMPDDRPAAAAATAHGAETVAVSWNGATRVASWRLQTGPDRAHLSGATSTATAGFETKIPVTRHAAWGAVQALDARGRVLGSSRPVRL